MNTVNVGQVNTSGLTKPLGASEQVIIKGVHYINKTTRPSFDKDIGKKADIIGWLIGKESGLTMYKVKVTENGDVKVYFADDLIFLNN